jgi:hypothetical protein
VEPGCPEESRAERPTPERGEPAPREAEAKRRAGASPLRATLVGLFALSLAGAAGAVVVLRVQAAGEEELVRSTVALQAKSPHEALVHARRAAGHYLPWAPHVRVARERLRALAIAAEKKGDLELSLASWRALHTSERETRWLATPRDGAPGEAAAQIARLSTKAARPIAERTTADAEIAREQLEALSRDEAPSKLLGLGLGLGLFAWAAGLPRLAGALAGARAGGSRARLFAPLVLTLGGLAAVLVGVLRA